MDERMEQENYGQILKIDVVPVPVVVPVGAWDGRGDAAERGCCRGRTGRESGRTAERGCGCPREGR